MDISILENAEITEQKYIEYYINNLESTISDTAIQKIRERALKEDIVLCCYERPDQFCHRHILADWLSKKANLLIAEVTVGKIQF